MTDNVSEQNRPSFFRWSKTEPLDDKRLVDAPSPRRLSDMQGFAFMAYRPTHDSIASHTI